MQNVQAAVVAVLALACLTASEHIIDRAIEARDIHRRATAGSLMGNLNNGTNNSVLPSVLSPSFVQDCSEYDCFCTKDSKGNDFDPDTGCFPAGCKFGSGTGKSTECECVWMGCDCTRPDLMGGKGMRCRKCAEGFKLYGDHCYVDDNNAVVTAILLVLGIGLVVAMIATCYSLGGMDPGRNSVIYRLTQQRIKAQ